MVPVLGKNKQPLMPCSEKRARRLMEKGEAKAYWKQGIFCIILQREPSDTQTQSIVVGIDPGSKRTGITATTKTKVIVNILIDTPKDVKDRIKTRASLRRSRRNRKTPYRKCRFNRKIGLIPPSTKARWGCHIRCLNELKKLIPVTDVVIEDVKAITKKGARKWNLSFSPLEVGKKWFERQVKERFHKFEGWQTAEHRKLRGFKKTTQKLKDVWEAHNVDSHSLCEMVIGEVPEFKGLIKCTLMRFFNRQLHVQNPIKGGVRKNYGGTLSMGIKRGTLVKHPKYGKCFVGGSSNGLISLHKVVNGERLCQNAKKFNLTVLTRLKWKAQFLSALKCETHLRKKKHE
jgi:hypothetical protein